MSPKRQSEAEAASTSKSTSKAKAKPGLFSRIKAGIKKLVTGSSSPDTTPATTRSRPPKDQERERPASRERSPRERDSRRDHSKSDRSSSRPSRNRSERERERPPQKGKRPRHKHEEQPREPRQRHAPEPPPPPPEVPPGPYNEAFETLGLSPAILAGIRDIGYQQPTEIQAKAAPIILANRDLIGASQTGTGKTAAFGMPSLSKLGAPGTLRCLILEPTRELAAQVVENFNRLNQHTGLRTLLVHGGVGYSKQREGLHKGIDIVVATPGRLLDFIQEGDVDLSNLQILILDEVDRMLDMGFLPDVRRIVEKTPSSRQTLLFSATMPPQIKGLADWALKDPATVEIGIRFSPAETVSHYLYPVASDQREELILELLRRTDFHSVMIFTRTKMDADRLFSVIQSEGNLKVTVMHSDISQKDREKALKGFREGEFEIIVATDLAARGLDVSGVTHVINYMVPENPEDYVHRIGRTGRAQQEGDAYTLFAADEIGNVASIERLIGQKIERRKLDNFPYKYTTVLDNEDKARAIMFGRPKKKGGRRR